MTTGDFRAQLKGEEARRQEQGMPPGSRAAVYARLRQTVSGERPAVLVPRWALAAVAAAALVVGAWAFLHTRTVGELQVVSSSGDFSARAGPEGVEVFDGQGTLLEAASGVSLENEGAAAYRVEQGGVRIVRGVAHVSVVHRNKGSAPAVILVSGGAIEVMGTRFTVRQGDGAGSVQLHEGAIRFRPSSGEPVVLRPGEALEWPLPEKVVQAPAPEQAPPEPAPLTPTPPAGARIHPHAKASPPSVVALLHEVDVLRGRSEYERAVEKLADGLRTEPVGSRERLSFELGSILTHQLKDEARACEHWAKHRRQYPQGAYDDEVARAVDALRCSGR
jgi:transmembrane sensor